MKKSDFNKVNKKVQKVLKDNGYEGVKVLYFEDNEPTVEQLEKEDFKVSILKKIGNKALLRLQGALCVILVWVLHASVSDVEDTLKKEVIKKRDICIVSVADFIKNPPFTIPKDINIDTTMINGHYLATSTGTSGYINV